MNPVQTNIEDVELGQDYLFFVKLENPASEQSVYAYGTVTALYEDVVFDENHDPDGYGTYVQIDNRVSFCTSDISSIFKAGEEN